MCKGICKKFEVKKPTGMGRYESGQGRCQTCEIWIDHRGVYTKGNLPATEKSTGWFCNCCNYRVRRKPRNRKYKEVFRAKTEPAEGEAGRIKPEIPSREKILLPVLQMCDDDMPHTTGELARKIAYRFVSTDEERNLTLNINKTILENVRWAVFHLGKAGIVTGNGDAITITMTGHDILEQNPDGMDGKFLDDIAPYEQSRKVPGVERHHHTSRNVDRLNELIAAALQMIAANPNGVYLGDLKRTLGISDAEEARLLPRLTRIDGIAKSEILYGGTLLDILLKYEPQPKPAGTETGAEPDIGRITGEMVMEHISNQRHVIKELRQRLTGEFVRLRSMARLVENNPDISKDTIKRHVRTTLRLPDELRKMADGDALHPDPGCSLQIALFAVNYCDWDGEMREEGKAIRMARLISDHLGDNDGLDLVFSSKGTAGPGPGVPDDDSPIGSISTAVAVWIATAMLHKEHGIHETFSNQTIIGKVRQQKLCGVSHKTISDHVAGHCVANAPTTTPSTHRKLYRVAPGMYRLYRRGEPFHRTREYCKDAPAVHLLPEEYKNLRGWYDDEYCNASDPASPE